MIPASCLARRLRALISTPALRRMAALSLLLVGCSNTSRLPSPFVFNSPGDMALACFDAEPAGDERVVLPLQCCATEASIPGCPDLLENRLRHALVTQTARGEVAAVDLDNAKVLDSERRVPGYTFVDVGGLPAAIVVPPTLPGRPEYGPPWTYVAGREVQSIRAIATCRFRIGDTCGPETAPELKESGLALRDATELPLPEPPQDMLLDPDGKALWVSLPKAGLIARIDLGQLPDGEEGDGGEPPFVPPFATESEGSLVPRAPTTFPVPSGIDLEPPAPRVDDAEYFSVCGTGYEFVASPQELPNTQRAASSLRALPTRMRLLPQEPGTSLKPEPLLFVADTGQAVLHAFAIVDGALQQHTALPVGAPLRDFVLTAPVPSKAPEFASLVDSDEFAYGEPPPDDKRYVFGIDGRDGSVMSFELTFAGETPALRPLLAPAPARQEVDMNRLAGDRLMFEGASARALEIIDTRYRALAEWQVADDVTREHRDALYCGAQSVEELDDAIEKAKDDGAPKEEREALDEVKDWTELGSRPDVLRGVFLVVAASDGRLTIIDIHDLNLQCRARAGCLEPSEDNPNPNGTEHSDDSSAEALALRRHARRVLAAEAAQPLVTNSDKFMSFAPEAPEGEPLDPVCPDGYYSIEDAPVCVVSDPWQARNLTWSVIYEGTISTVPNALLEREPGADQVTLWGPQAWDFCARGANVADQLKLAIVTPPDPDARDCQTYAHGSEPPLYVVEAYADHLVLVPHLAEEEGEEPAPEDEEDGGVPTEPDAQDEVREWDLDDLTRCYPGFFNAEIRLRDQYQVVYTSGVYLHRNHTGEAGVCSVNEDLDPRLTSRISGPDWAFQDFSLAFKLDASGDREEIAPVVQLTGQSSFLGVLNVDTSSGRADALPSRVRFFPGTEDLFVVDGASQGLRRYLLEPFQHDGKRFR